MSIVAIRKTGKGKFEVSADAIGVRYYTQSKDRDAKLWQIGDMLIGASGTRALNRIFREYLENHQPKSNDEYGWINLFTEFAVYLDRLKTDLSLSESAFIVVYKNKGWRLHNFHAEEVKDYDAVGAGMDYALAALHLGHDTKKAVDVACELSVFCEKPIKTLTNDL